MSYFVADVSGQSINISPSQYNAAVTVHHHHGNYFRIQYNLIISLNLIQGNYISFHYQFII
jgi:hypothetical protein